MSDQQKQNDILQCACTKGATNVAEFAISLGARVQGCDAAGDAPLAMAARAGHTAVAELLLERGAYIDAVNKVPVYCHGDEIMLFRRELKCRIVIQLAAAMAASCTAVAVDAWSSLLWYI